MSTQEAVTPASSNAAPAQAAASTAVAPEQLDAPDAHDTPDAPQTRTNEQAGALHPETSSSQADESARRRRVLMLTHRLPYPPDRGDRIRAYHMLRFLSEHVDLALACTSEETVWLQHHQLLSTMAKRVALYPISPMYSRARSLGALVAGQPITPAHFYRQGLAAQILQWHDQEPFDAVITFCTGMIQYARLLTHHRRRPITGPHVLDLVDVDSAKWKSYAAASAPPMSWIYGAEARRLRKIEAGQVDRFSALTVVSESEVKAYREHVGEQQRVVAVGNGVNMRYFHPQPDPDQPVMVFVGVLNYKPNVDGVSWFCRNVMPSLVERLPEARLMIVGRHPSSKVQELARFPGVEIVGSVPDVREYLKQASVVIAPLRIARGVQNKVLEAMSSARATVCSPEAAEGIDADPGQELVVAGSPREWIDNLAHLLTDRAARELLAGNARKRIEQGYSWKSRLAPLLDLLEVGSAPASPA